MKIRLLSFEGCPNAEPANKLCHHMIPPIGDVTIRDGRDILGDNIAIIPTMIQLFGPMEDRDVAAVSIRAMFEESSNGDVPVKS